MKLTETEQKVVEDNHKLIYWFANLKGLDIEEWYGLLAIELCKSVIKHDESRGSLSNYYKMRCDTLLKKEYEKSQSQKRANNGIFELQDYQSVGTSNDIEDYLTSQDIFNSEFRDILELKFQGYSQKEIADKLGLSQSQISKILRKVRDELDIDRQREI